MSKFVKSKSIKLHNTGGYGGNINRISQQHNKEVIQLNKTYSVQNPIPEANSIINNETINTNIVIHHLQTEKQQDDPSASFGDIYPVQTNIKDINPINNVVNKEVTINYGNKLDYLYKKQQYKK